MTNPSSNELLAQAYKAWCEEQGLPFVSMDEQEPGTVGVAQWQELWFLTLESSKFHERWQDKCVRPCPIHFTCSCRTWAKERCGL